jgi:hypothetical protein
MSKVMEICKAGESERERILKALETILETMPPEASPPLIARNVYGMIHEITGIADPYLDLKRWSNRKALEIYPKLKARVRAAGDPLFRAVKLAVAGNIIDYGARNALDLESELARILEWENEKVDREPPRFFDFVSFRKALDTSKSVLYLADNAGEAVFDRVLIEVITERDPGKEVIYAVRGKPIINDVLLEDALYCGLDRVSRLVSSGTDAPGTVLDTCRPGFVERFFEADLVISKGQGNFEALSETTRRVFFLFMAKCDVVANHVGCEREDFLLLDSRTLCRVECPG